MSRYIINRILSIVFTFFFISILVFILMHAIPGGPFDPVDMPLSDSAKALAESDTVSYTHLTLPTILRV